MKRLFLILICSLFLIIACYNLYHNYGYHVISSIHNKTVIVIDVGHGGSDPGKVSNSGTLEKDVNLQIAQFLKDYLIDKDYTVFLTRESDQGLYDENASNKKRSDLSNRIHFFEQKQADYVISVHQNSYPDASVHGAQCFYYTNSVEGEQFAKAIQDALLKIDPSNKRKEKASNSYFLLKRTSVPSIIVECGFLSNPEEASKLTDENYQKKIANAIAEGAASYIK